MGVALSPSPAQGKENEMKKNRIAMALVGLVGICSVALATDANLMKYLTLLGTSSASETGSAVDVSAYKGNATIVINWATGSEATYTGTVTIAHCATSGGTYSTITNLAGVAAVKTCTGIKTNQLDTYAVDLGALHKYVKVTAAHVNATNAVGVVLVAPMKSE